MIFSRQKRLLPYLNDLLQEATAAYNNVDATTKAVASLPIGSEVVYRVPDYPEVLQSYYTNEVDPVVLLPSDGKKALPPVTHWVDKLEGPINAVTINKPLRPRGDNFVPIVPMNKNYH